MLYVTVQLQMEREVKARIRVILIYEIQMLFVPETTKRQNKVSKQHKNRLHSVRQP